jgi:hypothetical protein
MSATKLTRCIASYHEAGATTCRRLNSILKQEHSISIITRILGEQDLLQRIRCVVRCSNPPRTFARQWSRTMSRDEVLLDFSKAETYECGAVLLAVLAYPADTVGAKRSELTKSLCSKYLRLLHTDETDTSIIIPLKPAYVFRSEQNIKKDVKTLERRLRDRQIAARMFRGFWQEAAGAVINLPVGMTKLSLNQLAELVADDAHQDPENIEARIWRPSVPVIHIAAAMESILLDADRMGNPTFSWGDVLVSRDLIQEIVRKAQIIERLAGGSAKIQYQLNIEPARLVKLEFAN